MNKEKQFEKAKRKLRKSFKAMGYKRDGRGNMKIERESGTFRMNFLKCSVRIEKLNDKESWDRITTYRIRIAK